MARSDPLFSIVINDEGHMNVAVRKDFWEHEDQDVIMHILTIATFLLSDNPTIIEAKNDFVEACSTALEDSESVFPQEIVEMQRPDEESDFDLEEYDFIFPPSKEIH